MSEASKDPALLFTPPQSTSSRTNASGREESPPPLTLDASTRLTDTAPSAVRTRFYVDVPKLSEEDRVKYRPWKSVKEPDESDLDDPSEFLEIEGEYKEGKKVFLYARCKDDLLRRKEVWEFRINHRELYDDYIKRKLKRRIAKFDPTSTRIAPQHRIFPRTNKTRTSFASEDKDYVSDSESSEVKDESDDSDAYEEDYVRRSTRASKRQTNKQIRALPYSPEKTRVRRGSSADTIEVSEESDDSVPRRRSTRNRKTMSYVTNDDSDYRSEDDESSDDEEPVARARSRQHKRQGPKPAYGRIRKVEDLYDSDRETAALREHRDECQKCHRAPAHVLLKKLAKRTKKKRKNEDEFSEDEEDYFRRLGGWVRCLKCCVAAHWNCLARAQRAEIIKAVRTRAAAESDAASNMIADLDVTETTEFVCGSCSKGGLCMMCKQIAVEPEAKPHEPDIPDASAASRSIDEKVRDSPAPAAGVKKLLMDQESPSELLFRCSLCKRLAHYSHLPIDDEELTPVEIAQFYQKENAWQCADCASYIFQLDRIIAWRPSHPDAVDPYVQSPENANYKENLPREYLVKWVGRSFRRVEWVPHMWLVASHWAKLKNFYEKGPRLDINHVDEVLNHVDGGFAELTIIGTDEGQSRSTSVGIETPVTGEVPPPPLSDAESRIPISWQTVDRVLDVLIWSPRKANKPQKKSKISKQKIVEQVDGDADVSPEAQAEYDRVLDLGEEPSSDMTETVDEFEKRTGRKLGEEHIDRVVWAFLKWDDLPYDESTWDSPPRRGSPGYADFQRAFKYYLLSRKVVIKKKTASEVSKFENRGNWNKAKLGVPDTGEYDLGQEKNLSLMPFQIHGVNWLCKNWFHRQQCILADEMGLGKTVQIITFIGLLHAKMGAFPSLVVVPNSTITNWVREFARWAPGLRVVPFYGEQKSREIIKKYELQHPVVASGTTGAKYHVLVATYEAVINPKDFNAVFKKNPRWEVLIVDEGQRLKSDSSLVFKRLTELNSRHRITMTGTPLNNNIRELFNLMNFLDPDKWNDLEVLTRQFEELDEERVKDLHERLRPYFLRRVKADVLDLPPKNEVIVPVSMAPLQKEIYKSILSKNLAVLRSLQDVSSAKLNKSAVKTSNLRNMLMQLRKCLQHPYLVADDIEPKDLSPVEAHSKLIDASGKLRLLKLLLPKLKARGHRVLLFSQFVIGLNIIEDFLQGEGYKFLRLDGNTKQADRQKDVDEFNRANSDVFIYMLSTRAGGVGINLWSADTVIIFDPDFNPHQDLQAIARAHRYGQKKSVLVFKLMTKDSAEEKIIQTGKKKLVLDHLIVQKMDNAEDYGEVQSILTFGARALFDEEGSGAIRDIAYSETEVDALIEKVETEGDKEASEASNNAFSFARVWSAQKDDLDELPDEVESDRGDSWAQTLQKIAIDQEREKEQEKVGRGARRKAAMVQKKYFEDGSPDKLVTKGKKRRKSGKSGSSDDEYNLPQTREASEAPSTETTFTENDHEQKRRKLNEDDGFGSSLKTTMPRTKKKHTPAKPLSLTMNQDNVEDCGLCFSRHGPGKCFMTENSSNLVEYRKILLQSEEESYDERLRAVRAIDETLSRRGALCMITGQPSRPLKNKNINHVAAPLPSNHPIKGDSASAPVRWQETKTAEERGRTAGREENACSAPFVSLKRVSSLQEHAAEKQHKLRICEICKKTPYHLPVHCPIVAEGPKSVAKALTRLTNQAGGTATLTALRSILRKQKKALEGCTDQPGSTQSLTSSSHN